jgi:hypothetical protein
MDNPRASRSAARLADDPIVGTPWQDNASLRGMRWRARAAYLNGQPVFGVDYQIRRYCRAGWGYQRRDICVHRTPKPASGKVPKVPGITEPTRRTRF